MSQTGDDLLTTVYLLVQDLGFFLGRVCASCEKTENVVNILFSFSSISCHLLPNTGSSDALLSHSRN